MRTPTFVLLISENVLRMFFSRSLMVSCLMFIYLIFLFYIFPAIQHGDQVTLTCIHYIFPPAFLLLQHEYLDIVLNATQEDLLVNLF